MTQTICCKIVGNVPHKMLPQQSFNVSPADYRWEGKLQDKNAEHVKFLTDFRKWFIIMSDVEWAHLPSQKSQFITSYFS